MAQFRIIPVIDILNDTVVHAIKGLRNIYKPLKSKITTSQNPLTLITELNQRYQFIEFYIANLDTILKKKINLDFLSKILNLPKLKIMLDPGITNQDELVFYSKYNINKLIIGLETIQTIDLIKSAIEILGNNKVIISIDMYRGKIISNINELKNQNPIILLEELTNFGINEIILLDLFRVGQKLGGIPSLYSEIRKKFNGDILIGGGIKDYNDLEAFKQSNFSGVLIATALHDGTLQIDKLKNLIN